MRTTAVWGKWILVSALWTCTTAVAAGLGQITVRSSLGQPLVADIALSFDDERELAGLSAGIASADAHRKANIAYAAAALGLRATIQAGSDGRRFIRVESARPVSDLTVTLVVELIGPGTQALRVYGVLLEPPEIAHR